MPKLLLFLKNKIVRRTILVPRTIFLFRLDTINKQVSVDSTIVNVDATGFNPVDFNHLLFSVSQNGMPVYNASFRMYFCKITENGQYILKLIPCYRKSDNAVGMYDEAKGIFYTNQGSGTFIKGPNVYYYITSNTEVVENQNHTLTAIWEEN